MGASTNKLEINSKLIEKLTKKLKDKSQKGETHVVYM